MTCPHCVAGVPHHTNSRTSIGGSDRHTIWELHAMDTPEDRGGLQECLEPDRARFPDSVLWQTGCPAWHSGGENCGECARREKAKGDAANDPVSYRIYLALKGIPHRAAVRVTQ